MMLDVLNMVMMVKYVAFLLLINTNGKQKLFRR